MHEVGHIGQAGRHLQEVGAPLLADQPAHHEHDGTVSRRGRLHRCEEAFEDDPVAHVVHLGCSADVNPGKDAFVFAALHQHARRPRAAPPLEAPTEDVRHSAVPGEVERAVDRVDRRAPGKPGRRQPQERRLGGMGLHHSEPFALQISPQLHEGAHVGQGELAPDGDDLHVDSVYRVVVAITREHRPLGFRQGPQLVGQDHPGGQRGRDDAASPPARSEQFILIGLRRHHPPLPSLSSWRFPQDTTPGCRPKGRPGETTVQGALRETL